MTLRCKGRQVVFVLADGKEITRPAAHGFFHDPEGDDWPPCSILFGPYTKTREKVEPEKIDREYYGDAPTYAMKVDLPPRSLAEWVFVGDVVQVFYLRNGERYPFPYQHKFKKKRLMGLGKEVQANLYRRGSFMRLELPGDCEVSWRGFVWP